MREKKDRVNPLVWIMYGIMILLTFVLLFISKGKYEMENPVDQQYKETISFADGWTDEGGNEVNLLNLYQDGHIKAGEEYRVYHSIPNNIEEGYTLNISARNVYYQLYVDDMLLQDVYNPGSQEVKDSFGRKYSMIPIEKSMAGKTIVMKIVLIYDEKSTTFLEVTLGLPQGHLLHFAREKMISILTCIIFFFVGILLVVVDIPINMGQEKNHELLALGLFSLAVGMWGLISTHAIEYFTGDGRTAQIAACLFLILIPLPLFIYIRYSRGLFASREVSAYAILSFIEFLSVWILEITNTADVQITLKFTHIVLGIGVLLLVSLLFRKRKIHEENEENGIFHLFRGIGLIAIVLGAIIDFFRYYQRNVADNAMFVRFGLLLFIMCFGVASMEKTIRAVKAGVKAELVGRLAYEDGLTGLANRTAFNEQLEMLQMKQDSVALIMFDVNDLKKVNDNLGHQNGDEMLVKSARLILDSFESIGGECYRIGGDEFVVILCKDNILEAVTDGLQALKGYMKEYNEQEYLKYEIHIAYGYAILAEEKCDMNQLYEIADRRMYECKKQMKKANE